MADKEKLAKKKAKMARRKQEVALQQELETQEEWEEMLSKEGLLVIDVYQEWCGPCKALTGNLRRMKNELGDDLLHFAVAKADTIDSLDRYRSKCEPCFLFYAGGALVAVVRAANSPLILRTITDQLGQEHKVLEGNAERKEIRDPVIAEIEDREKAALDAEEREDEEGVMEFNEEIINYGSPTGLRTPDSALQLSTGRGAKKGYTVAIIKPDAVKAGKVDEILEKLRSVNIEILTEEEKTLTDEEAREFYSHLDEEEYFDDLVAFMASGPSHVLVLSNDKNGEGIIDDWRNLIGPTSVEDAKQDAPDSWRALFGSEKYMNALHGSSTQETAARELAFFFPGYTVPTVGGKPKLQRTIALIRPDAFREKKDEILAKIQEAGFKVALQKVMQLTTEQARDFYKEHEGQPYYDELIKRMTNGPLLALGLAREDAVQGWRDMVGPADLEKAKEEAPDSLRAQFALEDVSINQLHGSDSESAVNKEMAFFFPMEQTVAIIKPDAYGTKGEIIEKIHDSGFRIAARKETTLSREMAEEFYAEHKDKEYFGDLVDQMCSGPTMLMVLSREDAVDGWRQVIGPTDAEQARDQAPDSLRALFGKSILENAVHGSSTNEHAKKSIKQVFGDLIFNKDGSIKESSSRQESLDESEKDDVDADTGEKTIEYDYDDEYELDVAEDEPVVAQEQQEASDPAPEIDDDNKSEEQKDDKEETTEDLETEKVDAEKTTEEETNDTTDSNEKDNDGAEQKESSSDNKDHDSNKDDQKESQDSEQKESQDSEQKESQDSEQKESQDSEQKESQDSEQKESQDSEQKESQDSEQKESQDSDQKESQDSDQKESQDSEKTEKLSDQEETSKEDEKPGTPDDTNNSKETDEQQPVSDDQKDATVENEQNPESSGAEEQKDTEDKTEDEGEKKETEESDGEKKEEEEQKDANNSGQDNKSESQEEASKTDDGVQNTDEKKEGETSETTTDDKKEESKNDDAEKKDGDDGTDKKD